MMEPDGPNYVCWVPLVSIVLLIQYFHRSFHYDGNHDGSVNRPFSLSDAELAFTA